MSKTTSKQYHDLAEATKLLMVWAENKREIENKMTQLENDLHEAQTNINHYKSQVNKLVKEMGEGL